MRSRLLAGHYSSTLSPLRGLCRLLNLVRCAVVRRVAYANVGVGSAATLRPVTLCPTWDRWEIQNVKEDAEQQTGDEIMRVSTQKWQMPADSVLCRRRSHTKSDTYRHVTFANPCDSFDCTRTSSGRDRPPLTNSLSSAVRACAKPSGARACRRALVVTVTWTSC
jgi:hypothetical protein